MNQRPLASETNALPTELRVQNAKAYLKITLNAKNPTRFHIYLLKNKVYFGRQTTIIDLRSKSIDCKAIKPQFLRAKGEAKTRFISRSENFYS